MPSSPIERAAVRGEQRGERVDDAGRPRVDQPEALLRDRVAVAHGQRLGVGDQLVPRRRRAVDAGLLEQPLVVVEGVEVDLVGHAVERAVDGRRRDHAGRPVGLDVGRDGLGRRRDELVAHQLGQPEVVDPGDRRRVGAAACARIVVSRSPNGTAWTSTVTLGSLAVCRRPPPRAGRPSPGAQWVRKEIVTSSPPATGVVADVRPGASTEVPAARKAAAATSTVRRRTDMFPPEVDPVGR